MMQRGGDKAALAQTSAVRAGIFHGGGGRDDGGVGTSLGVQV